MGCDGEERCRRLGAEGRVAFSSRVTEWD